MKNKVPMQILNNRTPHEVTFGTKPGLKYIRKFGCKCFQIPHQVKFGPRAAEAIFLGNTPNAYMVKEISTGKIIESRDVICKEYEGCYR
jgi:hypothetical protein